MNGVKREIRERVWDWPLRSGGQMNPRVSIQLRDITWGRVWERVWAGYAEVLSDQLNEIRRQDA